MLSPTTPFSVRIAGTVTVSSSKRSAIRLSESPAATSTTQAGSNTGSAGTTDVGTVVLVGATLVVVVASTVVAGGLVDVGGGELVVVLGGEEVVVVAAGCRFRRRGRRDVGSGAHRLSRLGGIRVADPLTTPSSAHALATNITPTDTAIRTRLANMHRGYARRTEVWHRPGRCWWSRPILLRERGERLAAIAALRILPAAAFAALGYVVFQSLEFVAEKVGLE